MRRFYLNYPKGQPAVPLEWTKQCVLLGVENMQTRKHLTQKAIKEKWTRNELISYLNNKHLLTSNPSKKTKPEPKTEAISTKPLIPKRGTLYTYRLKEVEGQLEIDCGFKITRNIVAKGLNKREANDIITVEQSTGKNKGTVPEWALPPLTKATSKDLYTYNASVIRVVDGDTIVARIDCGFNTKIEQILRLRAINAPEIKTPKGEQSKRFVMSKLKRGNQIIVRTSTPDKFGRYLADIFYQGKKGEIFLNQELIESNHAEMY